MIIITKQIILKNTPNDNSINTNENEKIEEKNNNSEENNPTENNEINKNNLTLDLYYSSTCPHCHAFLEYYDTIDENIKAKINFNKYEVNSEENTNKYFEVSQKINSNCGGVPLIVFNEEDSICGFSDTLKETFTEKLRKYNAID